VLSAARAPRWSVRLSEGQMLGSSQSERRWLRAAMMMTTSEGCMLRILSRVSHALSYPTAACLPQHYSGARQPITVMVGTSAASKVVHQQSPEGTQYLE
jgi:hypothetical protein